MLPKKRGRPKKVVTPVSVDEPILAEANNYEEGEVKMEEEMNQSALGIFKDKTGTWYVARLSFNSETGNAKVSEKWVAGDDKSLAVERFKMESVHMGIV